MRKKANWSPITDTEAHGCSPVKAGETATELPLEVEIMGAIMSMLTESCRNCSVTRAGDGALER